MSTFLGVACVFLIQSYTVTNASPVTAAQPAPASADSVKINCRKVERPDPVLVLECPAFDLIVSVGQLLPLATFSKILPMGGVTTTESVLMIGGSRHPALRLEKKRSDGRTQIGWVTIMVVDGIEKNVTCYLHPPQADEKVCTEGIFQLSRGQLQTKGN